MTRTRQERFRLGTLFVLVIVFFVISAVRLGQFQLVWSSEYSAIVDKQSGGRVSIPGERGRIYDRNGTIVADNVLVASLYAYPVDDEQLHNVSRYLEGLFSLARGTATKKYGLAQDRFRWIKRKLDDGLARRVEATAPAGLYLRQETQRIYPHLLAGKQIIGFTDIDHKGQAGVEHSYDSLLSGQNGWADIRRDGLQNTYRVNETALVLPKSGSDLVLTIDFQLQQIVERELMQGVEEYGARSGMAVFLDCRSGDILAMAHYDPDEDNPERPVKVRAISDQFEPGSVFKALTAAAVLEAGLVSPDDIINCENGQWRVAKHVLHDDKKNGLLTFQQVIEKSSNIGIAKCAILLGGDDLYHAVRLFGLGEEFGIGLPGETGGSVVHPRKWSDYTVAALAMGHAVAVTPLQMAVGFAAIANGGELVKPRIVLGQVNEGIFTASSTGREVIRRVISDETAATLRTFLLGVVDTGTATPVRSDFVSIAGKTGTAQVPDLKRHIYTNKYMASFAGFFPYENPQIAGIIVLQEPEPIHYGGWTAGPVFRRTAEQYLVARPDLFPNDSTTLAERPSRRQNIIKVPDLVGRDIARAAAITRVRDLKLRASGQAGAVAWQFPAPEREVFAGDEILTVVEHPTEPGLRMVDLKGLSIRQASAFLQFAGITSRIQGSGRVVNQSIPPGDPIVKGSYCQLDCSPQGRDTLHSKI
ncbi:MAG TPA: penicillin-binding transpeptidase domain-containing protein [Candidatus Deferrimicrobium sp.]|nr:penicillin-binding transpeptidase domain-containing protein [Candidatus Deferrimicrobium sp.]